MKSKILTVSLILSGLGLAACGGASKQTTTAANAPANASANANKPANTANSNTAKPANTSSAPKAELKSEKKPEGSTSKTAKKVAVPENWIYIYDETKGYGFYLPEGSQGGQENANGVDVFMAKTPAPTEIAVMVLAYKDSSKSKEDLLDDAEAALNALGEKIQAGKLTAESEDYSVADATSTSADGTKSKMKIVVGTDVTDNYVMIVGTDESKYEANKDVIDKIWGSFEMWSGGASGNN